MSSIGGMGVLKVKWFYIVFSWTFVVLVFKDVIQSLISLCLKILKPFNYSENYYWVTDLHEIECSFFDNWL